MRIALLATIALALAGGLGNSAKAADPAPQAYLVFFGFDQAELSPVAGRVLDQVIADFRRTRATSIGVRAHTDLAGPTFYNIKLSARRADAVKRYLAAHGAKSGAVRVEWYGKSRPLVATPDGVRNDQNRRCEIVLYQ
jgi:OOP family OmpA-OmpF porin